MSDEAPITKAEMVELFGEPQPAEIKELMFMAPDDWTVGRLRAEVRRIGASRKREAAEADAAVVREYHRLLHVLGDAADRKDLGAMRAACDGLKAWEALHPVAVDAERRRLDAIR